MNKHFARYDPNTGEIISVGNMQEKHIDLLINSGEAYIKLNSALDVNRNFKIDLDTLSIVEFFKGPDLSVISNEIKSLIISDLIATDYTQAADALDHLTVEEQEAWRLYRVAIRDAQNSETLLGMIKLLPSSNPKGIDRYEKYKSLIPILESIDNMTANTI